MHDDVGHVGSHVDDGLASGGFELHARAGRSDGADQRERDQVEPDRLDLGAGRGGHERVHHRFLRRHEQEAEHLSAFDLDLLDQVVVEDGFIDGHGDELLHLEPQRLPELLLGHRGQRDLANDDPLVPHAHPHLPRLEPAAGPELAQRLRNGCDVAYFAVLDRTGGKRDLGGAYDRRRGSFGQLGSPNGGRPDIESDPRLRH